MVEFKWLINFILNNSKEHEFKILNKIIIDQAILISIRTQKDILFHLM